MNLDIFFKRRHNLFVQGLGAPKTDGQYPRAMALLLVLGVMIIGLIILIFSRPPRNFPIEERITVISGSSLGQIAQTLKSSGVIRSRNAFIIASSLSGNASRLQAGDYKFEKPRNVVGIMRALAQGEHGNVAIRLTILEGATLTDIARQVSAVLDVFDQDTFINEALPFNGYLFPDTYFILPSDTEKEIVDMMHDRFSVILNEVGSSRLAGMSPEELRNIVIMASIIEREAAGSQDAYIISGILWKRIRIGMPLQVDASFAYLFDKESSELTLADLRYDSPYNTYINTGLPPGPLGNPGKIALDAALHPADSPYLYYLHDRDGNIHYGKTHDEHVNNKNKYLR